MIKELDLSGYGIGHIILKNSSDKQTAICQIVNKAKAMPESQKQNLIDFLRQKLIFQDKIDQKNDDMKNGAIKIKIILSPLLEILERISI